MLLIAGVAGLAAALSAPTLAGAHTGALVVDAKTGSVLFERNANDAFAPASTMKLLVGSVALSQIGPEAVFHTTLLSDGAVSNDGTLHGNLYLRGGGDPSFDAGQLADAARAVAAARITRIDGALIVDDSAFNAPPYPDGWTIDDLPNDYAAPITALAVGENAIHLRVLPAAIGAPATITATPQTHTIAIDNRTTTGAHGAGDTTSLLWPANLANVIRVSGTVPAGAADPVELDAAIPDPVRFAGEAFANAVQAAGIAVDPSSVRSGTAPASARVLWTHESPPVRALLQTMWLQSDNFYAETLLEDLAGAVPAEDTRAQGIARETQWLGSIGIDPRTLTIADGSGVSQYDRVTPAALVAVLRADWSGPVKAPALAALPAAGKTGTLARAFAGTPLEGIVYAKTGTMMHVRTLAGYIVPPSGDPLIFALLVNDWMDGSPGAATAVRAMQQQFLEAAIAP